MSAQKPFSVVGHIFKSIWNLFLSGLITILPITITFVIFSLTLNIFTRWLEPIQQLRPAFLKAIPYSEFLIVIIAIFLVGVLLKSLIFKPIMHWAEHLISKIPLVRPVYLGIKQLVHAFGAQDQRSFKRVVIVEFPRTGVYSIGFVTSEIGAEIAPRTEEKYVSVFIPTTPNPTSGYLILLPESQTTPTKMNAQEAMACIISGGIIQPNGAHQRSEIGL